MPTQVAGLGARATTACDDFNRAELGADWFGIIATPAIFGNMFGSSAGNCAAQHTSASVNYASAVISFDLPGNSQVVTYGVALHGLGGSADTFTTVQSQTVGTYANLGFYTAVGTGGGYAGAGFFGITPVVGGRVTVYIAPNSAGDVMVVDIDEDRDGSPDYTYTTAGVTALAPSMGTAIGLGAYSNAFGSLDDFELNGGCVPAGPQLSVGAGSPGGSMTFDFASAGSTVVGSVGFIAGTDYCGYFWSNVRGDLVAETFVGPPTIRRYSIDIDVLNNLNSGAQCDWEVVINGNVVDTSTVVAGQTLISEGGSSAPIARPNYNVERRMTNLVAGGFGSNALRYTGVGPHESVL